MQLVMLCELGSVIEADGFAHRLRKLSKLTGDGPSGEDCLSIDGTPGDVEAGFALVQEKQSLPISGEQHEVGLPMPDLISAFDLGGTLTDRPSVLDKAGWTAAATSAAPSFEFVAGQQTMPVILLGRSMIDKTID